MREGDTEALADSEKLVRTTGHDEAIARFRVGAEDRIQCHVEGVGTEREVGGGVLLVCCALAVPASVKITNDKLAIRFIFMSVQLIRVAI